MTSIRPVFYVSDGTGITAETIGHSLLTQFADTRFVSDRLAFVDDPDKARQASERIRAAGEHYGVRPIVVNSCVDGQLSAILAQSGALMLDVFEPFIEPLARELGQPRLPRVGQAHGIADFDAYHRRINAMNYALTHDDGVAFDYHLDEAFGENAMPPGVESALAMTVREAATNIQRHARAARAEVRFGLERNEAVLHVVDDGRGGAIVPGNGLSGMRERIEAVRGRLRVESGKGGTRIEVRIPLAANDDDAY